MIDRKRVEDLLCKLGNTLAKPARLTLIGSTASMIYGQSDRQTQDIDVWKPTSDFDTADLSSACKQVGLLYNPTGDIEPDDVYMQIVNPGIVAFPEIFESVEFARYGNLVIDLPLPALIVASKLTRGSESDLEDTFWWVANTPMTRAEIVDGISLIPDVHDRETATENLVFVDMAIEKRKLSNGS